MFSLLECSHMKSFSLYSALTSSHLPMCSVPLESHMTMFSHLNPETCMILDMAMFAAPAPRYATFISEGFLPTNFAALIAPAETMVPVPCWSSCQTGISHSSLRRSST